MPCGFGGNSSTRLSEPSSRRRILRARRLARWARLSNWDLDDRPWQSRQRKRGPYRMRLRRLHPGHSNHRRMPASDVFVDRRSTTSSPSRCRSCRKASRSRTCLRRPRSRAHPLLPDFGLSSERDRVGVLYRELQHRVANNLSFVASLLRLQRKQVEARPESALAVFATGSSPVRAQTHRSSRRSE